MQLIILKIILNGSGILQAFQSTPTRFHQSFILPVKFGLDKRSLHLSNLIWSKQIDRDAAILELKNDM